MVVEPSSSSWVGSHRPEDRRFGYVCAGRVCDSIISPSPLKEPHGAVEARARTYFTEFLELAAHLGW
jgi:hypothetical protein